jgi:hypothetical protein
MTNGSSQMSVGARLLGWGISFAVVVFIVIVAVGWR